MVVPASHRRQAGSGTIPPCNDTNHSHGHSHRIELYRINGSPTSALVADQRGVVWQRQAPDPSQLTLTRQARGDGRPRSRGPGHTADGHNHARDTKLQEVIEQAKVA